MNNMKWLSPTMKINTHTFILWLLDMVQTLSVSNFRYKLQHFT